MTDEPKQDESPSTTDEAFEEALDAARVFSDLAGEETDAPGEGLDDDVLEDEAGEAQEADVFADEFELPLPQPAGVAVETEPAAPAEPEGEEGDEVVAVEPVVAQYQPGGASIGELFKPVVKHSPPSKIRIESDSIGALFHRFIEQR